MDIEVVKPFNPLLNKSHMFAFEGKAGKGIEAGCFGAEKGDPFIAKCLEYYKDKSFIIEDGNFDMLPLPQIMQKIMDQNSFKYSMYSCE